MLDSYPSFSSDLGAVTDRFFTEPWIDAPVRPQARRGVLRLHGAERAPLYLMLNYTAGAATS